ncbi:histidine phosphatase family protein [Histidinibacterium aquaticum]|uniref:Histidine phosphatase family protein n=1 Tax=Histidinibacterium aquaticum TaxID=2613962 RepID=A0A5J5GKV6_9RHOB|nr:histidine phosphatase family protein [Histidinibacterium aquaticum]KAA9008112.1 histidine phosphatase family protein [Histidinibacterium aquaticum]
MTLQKTHTGRSDAEVGTTTLWLIRHAKVSSHQGDQPLSEDALGPVDATAKKIKAAYEPGQTMSFHSTRTKRSQQTADALRDRVAPGEPDAGPAWGLRNPDLYLFGSRVEMVSTAQAFADQVEPMAGWHADADSVLTQPFFEGFLAAPDRIEYWLAHEKPPGETAADVAGRVGHFARSLNRPGGAGHHAVCVTHSPVMRAVLIGWLGLPDPGEPEWVEPIALTISGSAVTARFRTENVTLEPAR